MVERKAKYCLYRFVIVFLCVFGHFVYLGVISNHVSMIFLFLCDETFEMMGIKVDNEH